MLLLDIRVSIIIPVLNEAESIVQNLQPLQIHRQQGHEIIVVDGRSRDNTSKLARPLCDRLISCEAGRARQMNTGADQAKGNLLLFLHADTRLPENAINHLIDKMKYTNKVWGRYDVKLSGQHPLLLLVAWLMNLRSRLTGIATGDQCIFVRREIFHEINGFPAIA